MWRRLIASLITLIPLGVGAAKEVTVQDRNGVGVPEVVVRWSLPPDGSNATVIDQINKQFVPFVSVIKPGTLVSFPNSDDIRHHVYSFSEANTFELKLYRANDAAPVVFNQSGLVELGCNIHDNMKAYVLVTDSATAQSNADGSVSLPDDVEDIEVWHPQLSRTLEWRSVSVVDGLILLPFVWSKADPQAARDRESLEERMKRFRNRDH